MKNKYIILIIVLFLLLIGYGIYRSQKQDKIPFNKVDLTEMENVVINFSTIPYIDTITYVGLERLGIKNKHVMIFDIKPHMVTGILDGHTVNGFVIQPNDTLYQIFIKSKLDRFRHIRLMSHELIHIHQTYSGRLIIIDGNNACWDGVHYVVDEVNYHDRPWEIHAYKEEIRLGREISNILY